MHHHYNDIHSRVAEDPQWFDEHSVPRYVPFAPSLVADIYADEAALALITCQSCGKEYHVAFSFGAQAKMKLAEDLFINDLLKSHAEVFDGGVDLDSKYKAARMQAWKRSLADDIRERRVHFGDPPNACADDCAAGAAMNSEPRRVLQYWRQDNVRGSPTWMQWVRDPSLEIDVTPDWVTP